MRVLNPTSYLLLLLNPPTQESLVQQLAMDLLEMMPATLVTAETWSTETTVPAIDAQEATNLLAGLESLKAGLQDLSTLKPPQAVGPSAKYFAEALDAEATRILDDCQTFRHIVKSAINRMGKIHGPGFERAVRFTREGALEKGLEQSEIFREAKRELETIMEDQESFPCEMVHYLHGGITLLLGQPPNDAQAQLKRAHELSAPAADLRTYLIAQLWASVCAQVDDPLTAYNVCQRTVQLRSDFQSICLAMRAATFAGRPDEAIKMFAPVASHWPIMLPVFFGDRVISHLGATLFQAATKSQATLRQEASSKLMSWGEGIRRCREVKRQFDIEISLPAALGESRTTLIGFVPNADLFTAIAIVDHATLCANEVDRLARRTLEDLHAERTARVDAARRSIDQAASVRDRTVDVALEGDRSGVERARETLRRALRESERAQEKCTWGLGMGCGGFVLYLGVAALLAARGFQIGPTSPVGMVAAVVTAFPFLRAIILQITLGLRRASLESDLHAKSRAAQIAYDKAKHDAELIYRTRIADLMAQLERAEAETLQSDAALRAYLNPMDTASAA